MVVDDEESVRELLRAILEERGFEVLVATTGSQALECMEAEGSIEMLVTDFMMPRINGVDLAEALARKYPSLKVLLMSGYPRERVLPEKLRSDQFAFVQKPFTSGMIASELNKLLTS